MLNARPRRTNNTVLLFSSIIFSPRKNFSCVWRLFNTDKMVVRAFFLRMLPLLGKADCFEGPLSDLELCCDLENMASNIQDEEFFVTEFRVFPSSSTFDNSSSNVPAASWSSFDYLSLKKRTVWCCRRKIQPVKVASQRETEFVVLLYFIL